MGQYLKMFTLLPVSQIDDVLNQHEVPISLVVSVLAPNVSISTQRSPEMRTAQRLLASEVTELVHGGTLIHGHHLMRTVNLTM